MVNSDFIIFKNGTAYLACLIVSSNDSEKSLVEYIPFDFPKGTGFGQGFINKKHRAGVTKNFACMFVQSPKFQNYSIDVRNSPFLIFIARNPSFILGWFGIPSELLCFGYFDVSYRKILDQISVRAIFKFPARLANMRSSLFPPLWRRAWATSFFNLLFSFSGNSPIPMPRFNIKSVLFDRYLLMICNLRNL